MRTRTAWSIFATVVLVGIVGALGYGVFQAGYRQGIAASAEGVAPVVYYPGGWGFGGFGLLFGVLFLFLIFGFISRMLFWRRRWSGAQRGVGPSRWSEERWSDSDHEHRHPMGSKFERWHERMHETESRETEQPVDDELS